MDIEVKQVMGNVPVTILVLKNNIDGSNYKMLIEKAEELYEQGSRDLLLDMSQVNFISSAGLVALHTVALTMQGGERFETDDGWQAIHALERDIGTGFQAHIKLLNPQPKISKILESTMIDQYIEVFTDEKEAIASF